MDKKYDLIQGADKIDAAIKANAKAHASVDQKWQVIAVSAIQHFDDCGDTGPMNRTFAALGKGARHVAMEAFFVAFGGVVANPSDNAENRKAQPFVKDRSETPKKPDVLGAIGTPWFTMKPSPEVGTVVDYLALTLKALTRAPKEGQAVSNEGVRQSIAEALRQYADENGIEISIPEFAAATAEEPAADELAGVADE
jgi:hypothetical protein